MRSKDATCIHVYLCMYWINAHTYEIYYLWLKPEKPSPIILSTPRRQSAWGKKPYCLFSFVAYIYNMYIYTCENISYVSFFSHAENWTRKMHAVKSLGSSSPNFLLHPQNVIEIDDSSAWKMKICKTRQDECSAETGRGSWFGLRRGRMIYSMFESVTIYPI